MIVNINSILDNFGLKLLISVYLILSFFVVVVTQLVQDMVFLREFQIERVLQGDSIPQLRATWELRYPQCFTSITITFTDEGINNVGETTLTRDIATTTQITQTVTACNRMVLGTFRVTGGGTTLVERSQRVYTGGKMLQHANSTSFFFSFLFFFALCQL